MNLATVDVPLISVVIPTYNYARFLPTAIDSVLSQTYPNIEVIIIDDGSADNTKSVIRNDERIHYYYQGNKGLAAARNAGIRKSKGDYLVFLDADDWLEKDGLEQNFAIIYDKPAIAFVSGNYYFFRVAANKTEAISADVKKDHYTRLLESNYIGMHAAVMFQRWVFTRIQYDETLKSCEDYDLYLRIARRYPVIHHPAFIATYYFHPAGLSHNRQVMMETITAVLKKQQMFIKTETEREAYEEGIQQWKQYQKSMEEAK